MQRLDQVWSFGERAGRGHRIALRILACRCVIAGEHAPNHDITAQNPIVIDLDATLVTAHSEKESATPTYKRGFGFHPLLAFVDHGTDGTGEPVAALLRPGNAGSNTAADHIEVTRKALAQLRSATGSRPGRTVMVRTDGGGASHAFMTWLQNKRVSYSIGFGLTGAMVTALSAAPDSASSVAVDHAEKVRDGAWVIDAAGLLDLTRWPAGMRVIIRKERPHPGAQLRFTDADGLRLTAFATNTVRGQIQDLELRHRRRARCEDRIRTAKDTGLTNFPLHGFDHNGIGLAIVALALDLMAWTQMGTETYSPAGVLDRRTHLDPCPPHPPEAVEERDIVDSDCHRIDPAGGATRARLTALHPTRRQRKKPDLGLWNRALPIDIGRATVRQQVRSAISNGSGRHITVEKDRG